MVLPATFPDLTSLDLFVTTVRLGSVSRAADAHSLSQPAASARIRGLEKKLGVALLIRGPGGSRPTDIGALVAEWAGAVIEAGERLEAGVAALRAGRPDRLRLAASFTIAEYLLPGWTVAWQREHTEIALELQIANSAEVIERLREERADLGFIESGARAEGLVARTVSRDELVVAVVPSHPWARVDEPLTAAALASTPLVTRERGSGTREVLADALHAHGLVPAGPAIEVGSTTAVKAAILSGAGPGVLSRLALADELRDGRLVAVSVPGLDLRRELRAVWLASRPLGPMAATLVAELERSFAPST